MTRDEVHMDSKPALKAEGATWVVIVATAGEPSSRRLSMPAPYRSTDAEQNSPLQQALRQAAKLAPRERIYVVVAAEHREWWRRPLWFLPASNVVVQPESAAIEESVSETIQRILQRDMAAKVVLLSAGSAHPMRYEQQIKIAPAEFPSYPTH